MSDFTPVVRTRFDIVICDRRTFRVAVLYSTVADSTEPTTVHQPLPSSEEGADHQMDQYSSPDTRHLSLDSGERERGEADGELYEQAPEQ